MDEGLDEELKQDVRASMKIPSMMADLSKADVLYAEIEALDLMTCSSDLGLILIFGYRLPKQAIEFEKLLHHATCLLAEVAATRSFKMIYFHSMVPGN